VARLGFRIVVGTILCVSFAAISFNEAPAQQRATCSQARSQCGTQRVCQRRYDACIETGCWTVGFVKSARWLCSQAPVTGTRSPPGGGEAENSFTLPLC
jgi:hypothetical protein